MFSTKRIYVDYNRLNVLINTEDWHAHFSHKDVNQSVDFFNEKIDELIKLSSNEIHRNYKNNKNYKLKSWIFAGLILYYYYIILEIFFIVLYLVYTNV